jgi:hypothetical protein
VSRKSRWQRQRNWFFVNEFAGITSAARFSISAAAVTGASSTAAKGVAVFVVASSAGQLTVAINKVQKVAWITGIVNGSTADA